MSMKSSRISHVRLGFCLSLFLGGIVSLVPANNVAAVRAVSSSVSSASVSANGGSTFTVTSAVPVAAPGTVSQSITMSFDPSRAKVTSANGIVAPTGWTLTYSTDGTTFGSAPQTQQGWAAVRAVRATGSIQSGGDSNGLQIATGSGLATAPPSGVFNAGGGGDGWDVAFDEQGNVYNTFHHDGYWGSGFITPGLHCHTRTGASCGPGWPFDLRIPNGVTGPDGISGQPWYHTNDQAMQWVDVMNNRVWIPTNLNDGTAASGTGFVCVDVSNLSVGPTWCGGSIRNAFVKAGPTLCNRECSLGLAAANGRLFAWDSSTGNLMCVDVYVNRNGNLPGAPCANQPYAITGITSTSSSNGYSLMEAQNLVWGSSNGKAMCFNPVTLALCSGWSAGSVALTGTFPNTMFDIPTSTGTAGAVCFARYDASRGCFSADGSSNSELSGSHAGSSFITYLSTRVSTTIIPKNGVTTGTRIYWSDGSWPGGGKIYCFDTSLSGGAGAACGNWPVSVSAYTATIDSQNPNCIWTNTDNGTISTIDAITGQSTCTTPPSVAEFSAPVIVPRLACSSSSSIQQWRSFKLTAPAASTYSTATLTVLSASGSILSGWNRVSIPANTRTVDLSSLNIQTSGLNPRFRVSLADKTTTDPIGGEVSVVGDAPQLCVPLQAVAWCPAGPSQIGGAMTSPSPISVVVSGEAQPSSGPAEQFANATSTVSVSPPSDVSCLGTISGQATMASSSTPVSNAVVRLLTSSGSVVASTTTDNSGNYSFTRLVAGSGYRVEFGPSSQGAANSTTVQSVTTDRTVTVNAATVVNGTYALLRTNVLAGQGAYGQSVSITPAPHDSTGTQTYGSFTKSATCLVDRVDNQCKASVTVAGEGTWSVDTASGLLSFAPSNGYSGTTTQIVYRVTETSSSLTTWNFASATISPQVIAPGASVGPTVASPVLVPASSVSRALTTGVLTTRVLVTRASQVLQTGTFTVNGQSMRAVNCRSVSVSRASTVTMTCTLTSSLRQRLYQTNVSVVLTTTIDPKSGTTKKIRSTVRFKKLTLLPATR
ncbi:MAG: Surface adhesin CshA repetitive domain [Actinomycetota bacterium]